MITYENKIRTMFWEELEGIIDKISSIVGSSLTTELCMKL